MTDLSCFKAYDIRGRVPDVLNASIAYALGRAFVTETGAHTVVVGRDARLSGPELQKALVSGLYEEGASVTDIGMCGTEEIYYAAFTRPFDGGIMITGSHNPADENGMKMVRRGAVPISGDSGLQAIRAKVSNILEKWEYSEIGRKQVQLKSDCYRSDYIRFLLDISGGIEELHPLKIHADAGNGCAGLILRELADKLPYCFSFAHCEPDGTFPHGVPNPLLPERRIATAQAVIENGADLGIAWDGDFDRCFFYDNQGNFIEGYYIVGLLAEAMLLQASPRAKVIHDPRLIWNTQELVRAAGGIPVISKTGHAFIKEHMRAEDAVYGGEMSAHHYFKVFSYCDSGMLPWLFIARLLCVTGKSLRSLVAERMAAFPCSGEINSRVSHPQEIMDTIASRYAADAVHVDYVDGLSMTFPSWRFNLRRSNTELLLRLNVESRGDVALMKQKTRELLRLF